MTPYIHTKKTLLPGTHLTSQITFEIGLLRGVLSLDVVKFQGILEVFSDECNPSLWESWIENLEYREYEL